MDETTQTISKRFKILPTEMQKYIRSEVWENDFQKILSKYSIDPQKSEEVKFELFLYLLVMQNAEELLQQIKDTLSNTPVSTSTLIGQDLLSVIPKNIRKMIAEAFREMNRQEKLETETSQEQNNEHTTEKEKSQYENVPQPETKNEVHSESEAGVDVIQEKEKDDTQEPAPQRNSLLHGIEDPSSVEKEENKPFNPVSSKLGGTTQTKNQSSEYKGGDPYREPIG
mgnify:CR=1 FL=1